jgi:hypothetical protein
MNPSRHRRRRRRPVLICLCLVGGTLAVGLGAAGVVVSAGSPGVTLGESTDRAAVAQYLRAVDAELAAIERNSGAVTNAIAGLTARTKSGCAGAAVDAPSNVSTARIDAAITDSVAIAGASADATIVGHLRRRVATVRWANARLAGLVRGAVTTTSAEADLRPPELCGYLGQWARSGFLKVPDALEAFSKRVSLLSEAGSLIPPALRSYETPSERALLQDIGRRRADVAKSLRSRIVDGRRVLLQVVGLSNGRVR